MNEPKPFPQVILALGESNPFVRDVQRALNIVETGVFDFLTMCHVVVHKFNHGLNHADPTVDHNTWNSIVNNGVDAGSVTREARNPDPAANVPPGGVIGTTAPTPVPTAAAPTPTAPAAPEPIPVAPAAPAAAATPTPPPPPPAPPAAPTAEPIPSEEHGTARPDQPSITASESAAMGNATVGDTNTPYNGGTANA